MVDSIKYTNPDHTQVLIMPENILLSEPYPPHRQAMIDEWEALGNEIQAFLYYEDWSEERCFTHKEHEIDVYGEELINQAYANPVVDVIVDPTWHKKKVGRRKSNKVDKIVGEIALGQSEKDEAKVDEKLSGFELKIMDDQDKAASNLHKLSGILDIMAFDVVAENWSTWVPPV